MTWPNAGRPRRESTVGLHAPQPRFPDLGSGKACRAPGNQEEREKGRVRGEENREGERGERKEERREGEG